MKLVQHLLDSKGREVISIVQDASVLDAIKLMADRGIGSLLVMDGDELEGIVTERDYARKVIIKVSDGKVVDMISIGDLVQAIISDQEEEIEQLEQYISG
jgi:CBS domain-containing protein